MTDEQDTPVKVASHATGRVLVNARDRDERSAEEGGSHSESQSITESEREVSEMTTYFESESERQQALAAINADLGVDDTLDDFPNDEVLYKVARVCGYGPQPERSNPKLNDGGRRVNMAGVPGPMDRTPDSGADHSDTPACTRRSWERRKVAEHRKTNAEDGSASDGPTPVGTRSSWEQRQHESKYPWTEKRQQEKERERQKAREMRLEAARKAAKRRRQAERTSDKPTSASEE